MLADRTIRRRGANLWASRQYLVKWKELPESEASREPGEDLWQFQEAPLLSSLFLRICFQGIFTGLYLQGGCFLIVLITPTPMSLIYYMQMTLWFSPTVLKLLCSILWSFFLFMKERRRSTKARAAFWLQIPPLLLERTWLLLGLDLLISSCLSAPSSLLYLDI